MRYKVEIEVFTPVIINSGDSYDYCEFIPRIGRDSLSGLNKFSHLDISSLFEHMSLTESKNFIDSTALAMTTRDENVLRKNREQVALTQGIKSKGEGLLLPLAYSNLKNKPMQNIDKIMTEPLTNRPYIPGSSVKGAIRTALLETKRSLQNINGMDWRFKDDSRELKKFEALVIKNNSHMSVNEDPFKYIKVTDFKFIPKGLLKTKNENATVIGKVGDDNKMPIYSAMTYANCFCNGSSVVFMGNIEINPKFFKEFACEKILNDEALFDAVSDFYVDNLTSDNFEEAIKRNEVMHSIWKDFIKNYNENKYAIRLGHYIGIQNYTFKVEQKRPPKKADPKINIKGGRITTVEGGYIPGLCLMTYSKI